MGSVVVQVADIVGLAGFILQMAITLSAIAFFHGQTRQRIEAAEDRLDAVEEKQKEHEPLALAVARLETEVEGIGREIKAMRESVTRDVGDLRGEFRRILDEFTRPRLAR